MQQQGLGACGQTRDVVTDFVGWLAVANPLAAHGDHRGAAGPVLHHPLLSRHASQGPGDVAPVIHLTLTGLERHPPACRRSANP
jgi:hypothetical protein